jgi:hypothetical protein
VPAFSSKEDVAHNGNIIIIFNRFFTAWTKRVGFCNRFTAWYPVYTDVQKTADYGAKYKNYNRDQVIHLLPVSLYLCKRSALVDGPYIVIIDLIVVHVTICLCRKTGLVSVLYLEPVFLCARLPVSKFCGI